MKVIPPERIRGPLGPSWDDLELLYWWPMRQPVPPLAYGTRSGANPVPGRAARSFSLAEGPSTPNRAAGGRFTFGYSFNTAETLGIEATYTFLGTRTFNRRISNFVGSPTQNFGLPYTNAATGATEILTLGSPGEALAALNVSTSNARARVGNQWCREYGRRERTEAQFPRRLALLSAHEGLRIEQTQIRYSPNIAAGQTADQFDAHNRFNGGQLGLHADMRRGIVFCEMTGKVAFGQNYEVVKMEGASQVFTSPGGFPMIQNYGGSGIYVQPSNFGRTASGVFAVVPEGTIKLGFRLGETGRLSVGYSFIYLSRCRAAWRSDRPHTEPRQQ